MVAVVGDILKETLGELGHAVRTWREPPAVERVVVGLFFTGVKLTNGHAGVCYTPVKSIPEAVCCPSSAMAMPGPGKMRGRDALELAAEGLGKGILQKTLSIAILNGLSSACFALGTPPGCDLRPGVDPVDTLRLEERTRVVVVGALVPYLRMFKTRGRPFHVLEQDPATLKADELPFYVPADRAADVVPQADVLVVTGSTLLTGTCEGLLEMARKDAEIVVVGPTSSMMPDAFFRRGVKVVAGIRIHQPDTLLDLLAEGGSGSHMFGRTAEKVALFSRGDGREV
jgi:uncharacterized protein